MAQPLGVDAVSPLLEFVVHVQGHHDLEVHVLDLGGKVEIAFEVRSVDNVDHHVGSLLDEVLTDVALLRREG